MIFAGETYHANHYIYVIWTLFPMGYVNASLKVKKHEVEMVIKVFDLLFNKTVQDQILYKDL